MDKPEAAKPASKKTALVPPQKFCDELLKKRGRKVDPSPKQLHAIAMAGEKGGAVALTAEGISALKIRFEVALREMRAAVTELHEARGTGAILARRKLALARLEESYMRDLADAKADIEG